MKANLLLSLFLVSLLISTAPAMARDVWIYYPELVNSNKVTVELTPQGEVPEWMAVIVQTNDQRQARAPLQPAFSLLEQSAIWLPFNTNMTVDLGPGNGGRDILFSFRYTGQASGDSWNGGGIVVQTAMPIIVITDPKQNVTSRPVVQLHGYFNSEATKIKYDLFDQNGIKTVDNENGLVTDTYFDKNLWITTTNYFQCFDVPLTPGTNIFVFHCEDVAGNRVATNFVIVFTTVGATNPPVITPKFPEPGMVIGSDSFIAMGTLDDPTAHLTGQISANGHTQDIIFRVGRSGDYYSANELPISAGANQLTLTATDAAGNISSTNMVVYGGNARVTMESFDPFHPVGPWITLRKSQPCQL